MDSHLNGLIIDPSATNVRQIDFEVMEIERLINRHKDAVYRQMVRVCGNQDDAEDALAEALLAAVRSVEKLRDPSLFQAWLAKIGTRSCMRMRIRERIIRTIPISELYALGIEIPDGRPLPDETSEALETHACVAQAMDSLPSIYKEVYMRRVVFGDAAQDVADQLGLSLPAVKSRLLRARKMMRESLDSGLGCRDLASALQ